MKIKIEKKNSRQNERQRKLQFQFIKRFPSNNVLVQKMLITKKVTVPRCHFTQCWFT